MIHEFTIYKGERGLFTNKLFRNKNTFKFTSGLNIITGRNGSGKSTLLKLITMKTGNLKLNLSPQMIEPSYIHKSFFNNEYYTIEELIDKKLSGKNYEYPKVDIKWDGSITNYVQPSFFSKDNLWKKTIDRFGPKYYEDLFSGVEILSKFVSNHSSGEVLISNLMKLTNLPRNYHKPLDSSEANESWVRASLIFQEWIDKVRINPDNEKPTLLIDELDKSLDLDNQMIYFNFLRQLTKFWQIIVVSHSYFAFKQENVNYINLNPKYFNTIRKL